MRVGITEVNATHHLIWCHAHSCVCVCVCVCLCMHAWAVCVCSKSLQSCLTLGNPMNSSRPGSSVHGILQARILEWVALLQGIFLAQESNLGLLHCRQILYCLSHQGVAPIVESRSLQKMRRQMDLILL